MYPKFETLSFVLNSANKKESDKVFALFSDKFGIISARAPGLRKESSKLRFALSKALLSDIVLLKSKNEWKIVEAKSPHISFADLSVEQNRALARSFKLVLKYSPKYEKNPELFSFFLDYARLLREKDESEIGMLENAAALSVMFFAGYVSSDGVKDFMKNFDAALEYVKKNRKSAILKINEAIKASQL